MKNFAIVPAVAFVSESGVPESVMTPEDEAPNAGFPSVSVATSASPEVANSSVALVPIVASTASAIASRIVVASVSAIYVTFR
jgi:hypothetical protein